jgi:ubiquitin-protein ligase E3 C
MFDGSHRSNRRVVNLGTSKRRKNGTATTTTSTTSATTTNVDSKMALLAQTQRLREQRRAAAQRVAAAVAVQRMYRGGRSRGDTARLWQETWQQQYQSCLSMPLNGNSTTDPVTPLLNARLRLLSTPQTTLSSSSSSSSSWTAMVQLLQQYATFLSVLCQTRAAAPAPAAAAPRIVQATLQWMVRAGSSSSSSDNGNAHEFGMTSQNAMAILSYTMDIPESHSLPLPHDNSYYWKRAGGIGWLVQALGTVAGQSSSAWPIADQAQWATFLQLCITAALPTSTVHGPALQCALRFLQPHNDDDDAANPVRAVVVVGDAGEGLVSLLSVLQESDSSFKAVGSSTSPPDENDGTKAELSRVIRDTVSRHLVTILHSLFATTSNRSLNAISIAARVQFLKLCLLDGKITSELDNDDGITTPDRLIWLLNRVARGDTVTASGPTALAPTATVPLENDYSSDDDDDDEMDTDASKSREKLTKHEPRFSKQDLQTVPKLDALWASLVRQVDVRFATTTTSSSQSLPLLAVTIVNPTVWLEWGNVLLTCTFDNEKVSTLIQQGRRDYIVLLAIMLQATTGLRPGHSSSSRLVKELASSPLFLSNLWQYIVAQSDLGTRTASAGRTVAFKIHEMLSFSLFSDIFAHRLIAMRDDQFLSDHTSTRLSMAGQTTSMLDAVDVIVRLRALLCDVYWTNPVRTVDMKLMLSIGGEDVGFSDSTFAQSEEACLAAARGRLIIAGTKLWNSLYERWCRLVRHDPFCDESTWCFPASISVENAVAADGTTSARRNVSSDDDAMDIVDSDSEMDEAQENQAASLAESDQLAAAFSHPKMARLMASIPQALPFDRRVKLFDGLLRADKRRVQDETVEMHLAMEAMMRGEDPMQSRQMVQIRRDRLYDDSMDQLSELGPKLKRRVQVSFINQHGAAEAGIDGGGVFKEFIDDLIKEAFSVANGKGTPRLFSVTPLQTLAVNSDLAGDKSLLAHYEFLGRVLGKAVYESILVEPQFCLPFLNQLLGKSNSIEDLKNFDPEYYRNLTKLLDLSSAELDNMGSTFELSVGSGSKSRTLDLVPRGRDTPVTKANVIQYIHLVSHQRLNVLTAPQTRAFLRGFRELIPASWVRLFSGYELQKVISGDDSIQGFDVSSLKQSMQYSAGYHIEQPVIQWFWEIVEEMSADQKRQFLKFMTSCSRPPLMGFDSLEPAPCVQQIRLPDTVFENNDQATIAKLVPLPTSSTCMNLLKLPNYRWKELMRQKLLVAIESGSGFELT